MTRREVGWRAALAARNRQTRRYALQRSSLTCSPVFPKLASYFQVEEGLLVTEVIEGTPAADAGLRPGDVVTRLDDRPVRTLDELRSGLRRTGGGEAALTLVRRGR